MLKIFIKVYLAVLAGWLAAAFIIALVTGITGAPL